MHLNTQLDDWLEQAEAVTGSQVALNLIIDRHVSSILYYTIFARLEIQHCLHIFTFDSLHMDHNYLSLTVLLG